MAIVIKEIHVCTTIEKEGHLQLEISPEVLEQLRRFVEDEIERFRLEEPGKKER